MRSSVKIYVDLIFYLFFLPLIIALIPVDKLFVKFPAFIITLVVFLYALYYALQKINLPQKFNRRQYVPIIIFCAVVLCATYLLSHFPYPTDAGGNILDSPAPHARLRKQTVWLLALIVMGFGLSSSLFVELNRQLRTKQELKEKQKNAELALYKAQINPHFLFNTLNTIYGLILNQSERTETAFLRFINLIKYTYSRVNVDFIPLSEEISYVESYIELQKLRLNHHTRVNFVTEIDDTTAMIHPIILISFVENAFKYGVSSRKDSDIDIRVNLRDGRFEFSCVNDIVRRYASEEKSLVGISNTIARLQLTYPNRYKLSCNEEGDVYKVNLTIDLTQP